MPTAPPLTRENFTFFNDTETNSTNITEVAFIDEFSERVANALNVYYTPVLIVLGTIGNVMSIIVFFSSKLRFQSTSQYLSALALSDTIFLLQLLPPWLNAVDASGVFTEKIFCQLFVYLSYVSCNLSSWLVVAFTVERFVAVIYPLRRNSICTVKRARHIILTLAISASVVNLPVLKFAVPFRNDCNIDYEYMDAAASFNLVDTALSFTLPLSLIIVLNSWIMVGVYRLGRTRNHLMKNNVGDVIVGGIARAFIWQKSQQRVTRMVLIVSSVFVMLNLPAYTMRIVAYANKMSEHEYSGRWAALQQICLLFFNTNFGINFFLYCMSGQNFRRALCQTFPCFRWLQRRRGHAARANTFQRPPRPTSVSTSFISNTEGTICTGASGPVASTSAVVEDGSSGLVTRGRRRRRCRKQRVVRRWRFDNSRQQQGVRAGASPAAASIEMTSRPRQLAIDI